MWTNKHLRYNQQQAVEIDNASVLAGVNNGVYQKHLKKKKVT